MDGRLTFPISFYVRIAILNASVRNGYILAITDPFRAFVPMWV